MGQLGFFDADNRLAALSAKGDSLEAIDRLVPWESFRGDIEAAVLTQETERKSTAGRKPIDPSVLFRLLILQSLCNLSDVQVEYQVRDRLSFTRFLTCPFRKSYPPILMMQSAQDGDGGDVADPLGRSVQRRILVQCKMRASSVVITCIGQQDTAQVSLATDQHVI